MGEWQPIETAPNDRSIILYRPTAVYKWMQVCEGQYEDDRFAKKPKPYWSCCYSFAGVLAMRNSQPTHWMPLPEPPK